MLPRAAVVDPELTYELSPALTAATGLDALTQLIEPFVSSRSNPLTDALCAEGIRRVARSLKAAHRNGRDAAARSDMSLASLMGGLALANAGLGAVHGFAASIGGMFSAPHGAVCAALLPHVMEINLQALEKRQPGAPALRRYHELGGLLTGKAQSNAKEALRWVRETCHDLHVPPLGSYGIKAHDLAELSENASAASSMKANPIALTGAERKEILRRAL